jgi:hypothetical protein
MGQAKNRGTYEQRKESKMKEMRKESNMIIPPEIDEAFDNSYDLLSNLTDKGFEGYFKDKQGLLNNTKVTRLGVMLNLKNEQDKPYSVIVTPSHLTDVDEFRKSILVMADGIKKNFPHLNEQQTTQ